MLVYSAAPLSLPLMVSVLWGGGGGSVEKKEKREQKRNLAAVRGK